MATKESLRKQNEELRLQISHLIRDINELREGKFTQVQYEVPSAYEPPNVTGGYGLGEVDRGQDIYTRWNQQRAEAMRAQTRPRLWNATQRPGMGTGLDQMYATYHWVDNVATIEPTPTVTATTALDREAAAYWEGVRAEMEAGVQAML